LKSGRAILGDSPLGAKLYKLAERKRGVKRHAGPGMHWASRLYRPLAIPMADFLNCQVIAPNRLAIPSWRRQRKGS
jgi:hypothetical protein